MHSIAEENHQFQRGELARDEALAGFGMSRSRSS